MVTFLLVMKLIALFFAIQWTSINMGRIALKNATPFANFFYQALATTIFIWLQWLS